MKTAFILLTKIEQPSSPPKWKIPGEEKKRFQITIRLPPPPKELWHRMMDAPPKKYYKFAGFVALIGVLGIAFQFQYTQYKLRRSEYHSSAIEILEKHKKLVDIIGYPFKCGFMFPSRRGGIKKDEVHATIPITGQKTKGILCYHATKDDDKWNIRSMDFTFKDQAGGKVRLVKDTSQES